MHVAELLLSAFLAVLFERMTSFNLLRFLRKEGLYSKIKNWEKMLKMIQAVLGDAEEKQLTDRAVKMWLDDLRDLAYDMEDILDEFATEALARKLKMEELDDDHQANTSKKVQKLFRGCIRNWSPRAIKFNRSMEFEIKDVTSQLEGLCKHRADLGLREIAGRISSTVVYQRPSSTSLPTEPAVYGRDQNIAKVMEMVLNDDEPSDANFHVIPIVGMGGIGITTLAQEVHNDNKAVRDFEPRAWVCISKDFNVLRISNAILGSITQDSCDYKDLRVVQIKLKEAVTGKKFLLVSDDVWSKDYGYGKP